MAFPIHTDLDSVFFQDVSEVFASKLVALIRSQNLWLAIPTNGLLKRFDTKICCQGIGYSPGQDLAS